MQYTIDCCFISTTPVKGICKSPALWGNCNKNNSMIFPLIYFRKPKWLDDESFSKIVESMEIVFPENINEILATGDKK